MIDERYAHALRVAGIGLWARGPMGDDPYVPASIAAMAGLASDARTTWDDWLARVHPRDRDRVLKHLMRESGPNDAHGKSSDRVVYRIRHADGRLRWIEMTTATVPEAHGSGRGAAGRRRQAPMLVGTVADVTTRVRDGAARRLHRDIWESLPWSAAVLDQTGCIVEVNPAWEAAARVGDSPIRGLAGDNYLQLARQAPAWEGREGPHPADGIADVLADTTPLFVFEYRSVSGHDSERWIRLRALALHRPARGAVIVHDDITDCMTAEWAAQRRRDDLTHMQRLATLGELATSIAHELNQPLAAIMASASTARRLLRDHGDMEMLKPIVRDVLESTARAAEVVRRARAMVRHDDAVLERLSVNELVSGVARLLASDLVIRQVSLRLELDPDARAVMGDRIQLQQVLLNLLLNAMDAVDGLPAEQRAVTVSTRQIGDGDVEFAVHDTGRGIPPGMGNRIFEPFVTTKRKGTGLGLAIVRAIVHAHGGRVAVESPAGGGAVFRVTLSAH